MTRRAFLATLGAGSLALPRFARSAPPMRTPNIVLILADDLGYGDLGCYGQKQIQTPNLDRMATEGLRFTDAYAGSTVCAPSRCVLMLGQHTGHCIVRGNALVPLRPEDVTVAEVLKQAGYATALIGKWGLGEPGTSGLPTNQGFDTFFGYLNQHHAHNYWPDYLWRNEGKVSLDNVVEKGVARVRKQYAPDLITAEALAFIERSQDKPFFLYFTPTLPHANNEAGKQGMEIPSDAPYSDQPWPQPQKNHAAMITWLDRDVGRLLDLLKKLGLDEQTLVFFTSDNGPHREGGADPAFFHSSGPLRGLKRDLTEGGIRVPLLVRWPGRIRPGQTSGVPVAFWDFLPTAAQLAGAEPPKSLDGVSFLSHLLPPPSGEGRVGAPEAGDRFFYWEFHEGGFSQAVRMGRWKAIRHGTEEPLELYDLAADLGETKNVAADHQDIIARIQAYLQTARTPNDHWKPLPRHPSPKRAPAKRAK